MMTLCCIYESLHSMICVEVHKAERGLRRDTRLSLRITGGRIFPRFLSSLLRIPQVCGS
jgi:hypothetical protein